MRDGKEKDFEIELATRESKVASADEQEKSAHKLGITVQNLTPELAQQFGYKDEQSGVIVTEVESGSPAETANIAVGTLIMEVNRQKVKDADNFWELVNKTKGSLLLYMRQGEYSKYVVIKLAE